MSEPYDGDVGANVDTFLINHLIENSRVTACDGVGLLIKRLSFYKVDVL